jgi:hypothetical protein
LSLFLAFTESRDSTVRGNVGEIRNIKKNKLRVFTTLPNIYKTIFNSLRHNKIIDRTIKQVQNRKVVVRDLRCCCCCAPCDRTWRPFFCVASAFTCYKQHWVCIEIKRAQSGVLQVLKQVTHQSHVDVYKNTPLFFQTLFKLFYIHFYTVQLRLNNR